MPPPVLVIEPPSMLMPPMVLVPELEELFKTPPVPTANCRLPLYAVQIEGVRAEISDSAADIADIDGFEAGVVGGIIINFTA